MAYILIKFRFAWLALGFLGIVKYKYLLGILILLFVEKFLEIIE